MSVPSPEAPLRLVPPATLPVLRLLPVPASEPPYDDELPLAHVAAPATPWGPLRALVSVPLRLVPDLPSRPADDVTPDRIRTPVDELPPARTVARALVQGLLEVLAGVRAVRQLQRLTTPELFLQLEQAVHAAAAPTGLRPGTGAVRSLHVQERAEGVAEVCATVRRGPRMAAFALRLEDVDGRWCCTELVGL
ncbi:MAG: Rv3235 family protein [Mycobacteriales bacterium]